MKSNRCRASDIRCSKALPIFGLSHRYQNKAQLSQLVQTKKELQLKRKNSLHLLYWQMSIQYGIKIAEAKLKCCNEIINELEKLT